MEWKIIGRYRGEREEIDSADTLPEARYMLREYRLAFGPEWSLSIRRGRKEAN